MRLLASSSSLVLVLAAAVLAARVHGAHQGCCTDLTMPSCVACTDHGDYSELKTVCDACSGAPNPVPLSATVCDKCRSGIYAANRSAEEYLTSWSDGNGTTYPPNYVFADSSDLELPLDSEYGAEQMVGVEFTVDIPFGAIIASAHIQFAAEETSHPEDVTMLIAADASVTPADLTGNYELSSRHTTASVPWSPPAWTAGEATAAQRTPDLSALLQPLVYQHEWYTSSSSTHHVVFLIRRDPASTSNGTRTAAKHAPGVTLSVTYTAGETLPGNYNNPYNAMMAAEEAEVSSKCRLDSVDLDMPGEPSRGDQLVGVQFHMQIPHDQEVLYAAMRFTSTSTSSGDATLRISSEGQAGVDFIRDVPSCLSSRTRTTTTVDWAVPAWYSGDRSMRTQTPDMSHILTELVSYPTWSHTTRHTFFIERSPLGAGLNGTRAADSGNGLSSPFEIQLWMVLRNAPQPIPTATPFPSPSSSPSTSAQTGADVTIVASDAAEEVLEIRGGLSDDQLVAGTVYTSSSDLELGYELISASDLAAGYEPHDQMVAVRFNNVSVDPNARIEKANIVFTTADPSWGGITLRIMAEKSGASPAALSGTRFDLTLRQRTVAYVQWEPAPWMLIDESSAAQRTVNMGSVIEEVVSEDGWARGNDVVILILRDPNHPTPHTESFRSASSGTLDPSTLPVLSIHLNHSVPAQPLIPTTGSIAQRASEYGEEPLTGDFAGMVYVSSSDLELPIDNDYFVDQMVALRFNNLDIPPNARITSASVQFEAKEANLGTDPVLEIHAQNPPPGGDDRFNYPFERLSDRPTCPGHVTWTIPPWTAEGDSGPAQQTPDLTQMLQRTVTHPSWSTRRSVVLFLRPAAGSAGVRIAHSGEYGGAPLLRVEYDTAGVQLTHSAFPETGEEDLATGDVWDVSSDLEMFYDPGFSLHQMIGVRFPNIQVPRLASVVEAYVQFHSNPYPGVPGELRMDVMLEHSVQPAPIYAPNNNASYGVSNRSYMEASLVAWSPPDWEGDEETGREQTPDLAQTLTSLVAMPGWQYGNPVMVALRSQNLSLYTGIRVAATNKGSDGSESTCEPCNGPVLYVIYQAPPVVGTVVVDLDMDVSVAQLQSSSGTVAIDAIERVLLSHVVGGIACAVTLESIPNPGGGGSQSASTKDTHTWTRAIATIGLSSEGSTQQAAAQLAQGDVVRDDLNSAWAEWGVPVSLTTLQLTVEGAPSESSSPTAVPSSSPAPSSSASTTRTPSRTQSPSPTTSRTPSTTKSPTVSRSVGASHSSTQSPTRSPSRTPSTSPSPSASPSPSPSPVAPSPLPGTPSTPPVTPSPAPADSTPSSNTNDDAAANTNDDDTAAADSSGDAILAVGVVAAALAAGGIAFARYKRTPGRATPGGRGRSRVGTKLGEDEGWGGSNL